MSGDFPPFQAWLALTKPTTGMTAMAVVCLLQYLYFVWRQHQTRKLAESFRQQTEGLHGELRQLNGELKHLHRERNLQRIENQLLREVLSQTECAKAIQALLRRFVPNPDDAFALFLPYDSSVDSAAQSRGLSPESFAALSGDVALLSELTLRPVIHWELPTPARCPFFNHLTAADRRKVRELFAFAVADEEGVLAALITTTLLPVAAPRQEQIELTRRLMQSIAPGLRSNLNLELQASQLRSTREMLELRSIADAKYDQPFGMLEQFLTRLLQILEADRAALYLSKRESGGRLKAIVQCGLSLQAGVAESWQDHEERLAVTALQSRHVSTFDRQQLSCLGIQTLIGTAALTPILHNNLAIGVICVTRRTEIAWTTAQRQLLGWSGETISQALRRVMSFAVVERQARLDGLTGLANRRTFDAQLNNELEGAGSGVQAECSLLLLDLDRFKSVNDVYGHQAGDEVLRSTARLLREQASQVRNTDRLLLARYGGEELAVLLPGIGLNGARRIAENIRQAVESQPVVFNGLTIRVTVSIGVATWPIHAQSAETLVAAADAALYQAKSHGRNRVVCGADQLAEPPAEVTLPALPAHTPVLEGLPA
uniref:diguanylate cyclase n=1 Tax=Schlesneria paludicola TaxID=360056 RepID=A0A7C4LNY0_9PLAN